MDPEEYEHHIAQVLTKEGWDAHVTPYQRDFGVDVVAERAGIRLAVQAKMYGSSNRSVAGTMVMQLHGAAAYADCDRAMIVTDGRVLPDAHKIAQKLGIRIRIMSVPACAGDSSEPQALDGVASTELTFGRVWREYVKPMEGRTLTRSNGKNNEILRVDDGGIMRRTSTGRTQHISIEIFRWAIEKILAGETLSRDDINGQYVGRASSGTLILGAVPAFEIARVGREQAIRLRAAPPPA